MLPSDKEGKGEQAHKQTYDHMNTESTMISVNTATGDEEEEEEELPADLIECFMDDEGKYYYQSTEDEFSALSEPEAYPETEEAPEITDPVLPNQEEAYQAVNYAAPKTNEKISYVIVDGTKRTIKIDVNVSQTQAEEEENDGYNIHTQRPSEDKEAGVELFVDTPKEKKKKKKKKREKNVPTGPVKCNFCSYTASRGYLLQRHMRTHSEDRPHKCNVCERGYKTITSLQNHLNWHKGIKPHVCKICNSSFTTSGEMVRHVRYKHTRDKPHKCLYCEYASVEISKLRRHILCHTGEKPYQCLYCTYSTLELFQLKRHTRKHTGEKPYQCDDCDSSFAHSRLLKAHRRIHNIPEKPVFSCELCPAKCSRKTDLSIHVQKLHTSVAPITCRTCGTACPDRYSYKQHNKTHNGEKCFKCNLCAYASTTQSYLNMHMHLHSQEKPFVCDLCDSAFRQKQLLRRHMNLYHNPDFVQTPCMEKTHSCLSCERSFAHKGNLTRHLAVHDLESEQNGNTPIDGQKKLNIINEEPLEGIRLLDSDEVEDLKRGLPNEDKEPGKLVRVTGDDGQQYVMLDVVQLDDGTELQVIVPPVYTDEDDADKEHEEEEEEGEGRDTSDMEFDKAVDAFFGFDDEDALIDIDYTDFLN